MPGLAAGSDASSKDHVPSTPKKRGGRESLRDTTKKAYYNYEMPKQGHPDTGVSPEAGGSVNMFLKDIFERVAREASRLAHYNKRSTDASQELHTAMRLLLPQELAKHAGSKDTKAATKYTCAKRV
ncbi:late histone H2B.L4-like [Marmota marmota marmota]|uniref:late histone H2B.L4-like n=1 Tax=Marmota marmota marmota TaxID=9994 RepID=UPI0007626F15|nr:late histone H2B.L4-like [Marmota marmota marmota]